MFVFQLLVPLNAWAFKLSGHVAGYDKVMDMEHDVGVCLTRVTRALCEKARYAIVTSVTRAKHTLIS